MIFTCYRAALYSFLGAFIAVCFGPANVGRVLGCSFFVGGLFTLLLIPAQYAANAFFNGSHRPLTGLLLFCCIPAGWYPFGPVASASASASASTPPFLYPPQSEFTLRFTLPGRALFGTFGAAVECHEAS